MAEKRVWTVTVDGEQHVAELYFNSITGLRQVRVDGQVVDRAREWIMSGGSVRSTSILNDRARVWLVMHASTYRYYLTIDGRPVPTDSERKKGIDSEQLLARRDMQDLAYRLELGQRLGFRHHSTAGAVWKHQHRLVGVIQKHPVIVFSGVRGVNENATLFIAVWYAAVSAPRDIEAGILNDSRLIEVLGHEKDRRDDLKVYDTATVLAIPLNRKKLPPDELAHRILTFVDVVHSQTAPYDFDHCERCGSAEGSRMLFLNNELFCMCQRCIDKIKDARAEALRAEQSKPSRLLRGMFFGLGASLLTAPLFAAVVVFLNVVGTFMGLGVFLAVFKAMDWAGTRHTNISTLIAAILCLPGILLGTMLALTWDAFSQGVALTPKVLAIAFEFTMTSDLLRLSLYYAGLGVFGAIVWFWRAQRKARSKWLQPQVEYVRVG